MKIAKWICTLLMLLVSILTFKSVLKEGICAFDWIEIPIRIVGIVLAILTSFFWFKSIKKNRNVFGVCFTLLPFVLILVHFLLYFLTYKKINKEYFLFATNPDEHSHQFKYYFRKDGTLKTNGFFFLCESNCFQNFKMNGDIIYLDTILYSTGIQSKIYLKTIQKKQNNEHIKLLIPLDNNYQAIDSFTKFIVESDKTK